MGRYGVVENVSNRGKERRACVEIHELGPLGATVRVVARTPLICGSDAAADARLSQARRDAGAMCVGLCIEGESA